MRFGQRAKKIQNNAVINVQYSAEELQKQLDLMKKEMNEQSDELRAVKKAHEDSFEQLKAMQQKELYNVQRSLSTLVAMVHMQTRAGGTAPDSLDALSAQSYEALLATAQRNAAAVRQRSTGAGTKP